MSKEPNHKITESESRELITWEHPLVKHGIVPGYLLQTVLGYSDSYWRKWWQANQTLCKSLNGEPWFSLAAVEDFLGSRVVPPHEKED